ncbi:MAG: fasciclin, partial [Deinococcus sp.]|nr:fasciclin [Deinococcus sp.]
ATTTTEATATTATTTTAATTTTEVAAAPAATATTTTATTTVTTTAALLADPRFSTLAGLIQAAGLADTLNSGTYTIFAPTNDAFAKVSASTLSTLQADVAKLRQVLLYHVVAASIDGTNLAGASEYTSAQGGRLAVTRTGTPTVTRIGDASIDLASALDVGASKVYAIDTVLIPQELR